MRDLYLADRAPQVVVRNPATSPVTHIVLHLAYEDLLHQYQEPTQVFDTTIAPGERVTLSAAPISGSIAWGTLKVFFACEVAPPPVTAAPS
jgi:hypothetical protein